MLAQAVPLSAEAQVPAPARVADAVYDAEPPTDEICDVDGERCVVVVCLAHEFPVEEHGRPRMISISELFALEERGFPLELVGTPPLATRFALGRLPQDVQSSEEDETLGN